MLESTQVSTMPTFPEPTPIQASDFGIPDDVKDQSRLNPEQQAERMNNAVQIKVNDLKKGASIIWDHREKLEEVHEIFKGMQSMLGQILDANFWTKYAVVLPEGGASYVDVHSDGPYCEFTLFVEGLAEETAWIKTAPFDAPGRIEPLNLPEGNLVVNGQNIPIKPGDSLKNITTRLNAETENLFKVTSVQIKMSQNGHPGQYQLSFQKITEETPYVRDDQGGSILSKLGIQNILPQNQQKPARVVVDGISMEWAINQAEGVIEGVKIALKKAMPPGFEPLTVRVEPQLVVVKTFLTNIAKLMSEYEKLANQYVPLGGQIGPLTSQPYIRRPVTEFKILTNELKVKMGSALGMKQMSGVWVLDPESFDETVKDFDGLRDLFVGQKDPDNPLSGCFKGFADSLKKIGGLFENGLQRFKRDFERKKSEAQEQCNKLDQHRSKIKSGGIKYAQALKVGDISHQFQKNMLELMTHSFGGQKN